MRNSRLLLLLVSFCGCLLSSCGRSENPYEPIYADRGSKPEGYSFAVHPLHNPALLQKTFGPLIDYLNANTGGEKFRLVSSRDYASFGHRLASGEFDFALPNPYDTVLASAHGYRIFGKVGGDENFRGIIITRRNSPIHTLHDLTGKSISYPAPTAVAGTMMPQYYLQQHGVPINSTKVVYVGSMESSIQSVLTGATDAGALWPDPWQKYIRSHPQEAQQLRVRWITPPLVNNGLVVRKDIPPEVAHRVLMALRQLSKNPSGRRLLMQLEVARFEPANDATYDRVRRFVLSFSAAVRPVPLARKS